MRMDFSLNIPQHRFNVAKEFSGQRPRMDHEVSSKLKCYDIHDVRFKVKEKHVSRETVAMKPLLINNRR